MSVLLLFRLHFRKSASLSTNNTMERNQSVRSEKSKALSTICCSPPSFSQDVRVRCLCLFVPARRYRSYPTWTTNRRMEFRVCWGVFDHCSNPRSSKKWPKTSENFSQENGRSKTDKMNRWNRGRSEIVVHWWEGKKRVRSGSHSF